MEEEEKKEQELEERMRNLRKERQRKRQNDRQPSQPKRKRQKMDLEHNIAVKNVVQEMRRGEKTREKQQSLEDCLEQTRKRRKEMTVCSSCKALMDLLKKKKKMTVCCNS